MARFEYTARDESGNATTGEIVAGSRMEASKLLRSGGKFIVRLAEVQDEAPGAGRKRPVKRGSNKVKEVQVIYFTNQLAVMVDTGVPLADALRATIEDEPPGAFKEVIQDVIENVQAGQEFSISLARHPKVFPKYFSNIIRASEASGLMGTMLQRIAVYMTQQRETRKRVKRAFAYPVAMIIFAVLVAIILVTTLLPKFTKIYAERGVDLPTPTQLLVSTSEMMLDRWYIILPGVLGAGFGVWYFLHTPIGQRCSSWLKINFPLLGSMFRKSYITNCMRTMGTMIDAGVSMLETVAITRNIVGNHYYEELLERVDDQLRKGSLLSESLKGSDLFPHTVVQMVLAAERAGQMGPVMHRIADFCEKDLENSVKTTTAMIEPALIVFMGIFIGGVVIALLLPIITLSRVVSG